MSSGSITILIAEDDDGHAELIMEGLRESGVGNEMVRFRDGVELLRFLEDLKGAAPGTRRVLDHLLLLDVNMPRLDGIEALDRIKSDSLLRDIPIIMLTTLDDPREIERCYRLGCNLFVPKPVDFNVFAQTLNKLGMTIQIIKT